jgi:NTP pyrophosphatase (non-canonical NTP hydrolase)
MSYFWFEDIATMHDKFGFHPIIKEMDKEKFKKFLNFRAAFIQEELDELKESIETDDAEEIVDALIDIIVVALGTLDLCDVDSVDAWDEVLAANMSKEAGHNPSRPNELGFPDLIKPEGWKSPSHINNHGIIPEKLGE